MSSPENIITEEVQEGRGGEGVPAVEKYSGIEILTSCLSYIIIIDDKFIGYKPRFFGFDEAVPSKSSDKQMACIADLMIDYPHQTMEIIGYTDNKGSQAYNLALSKNRSASIVDELISLGVTKEQLSSVGFGESNPLNNNETEEQRSLNRRVEFIITK